MERIECQWCRLQNEPAAPRCVTCGAPLDVAQPGQRLGLAGGAPAAGHDRVPLRRTALPGRGRDGAGRRDHPGARATPCSSSTTCCCGRTSRRRMSAMPTGGGMKRALGGMPFVVTHGLRAGPGGLLPGRDRRAGRAAAAPGDGARRPRARLPRGVPHHHLLLRADQGPGQPAARRQRDVPRPLRHRGRARACCCCTATATSSSARSGPGEKILVEPGAFLYKDASVTMEAGRWTSRPACSRRGMYLARDDRPRAGRHPVDVRPPPHRVRRP